MGATLKTLMKSEEEESKRRRTLQPESFHEFGRDQSSPMVGVNCEQPRDCTENHSLPS